MYPQTDPPRSPKEYLPTMYDLPSESAEEPGLPDQFHLWQPRLLDQTFCPPTHPPDQVFVASDLNLYFDPRNPQWHKRPDWFAVVGVPRLYEQQDLRLSYVIWQEGVDPFIVIEFLSPSTEKEDLGKTLREATQAPPKWEVYEQILRVPYYVVFNRYTNQLRVFRHIAAHYEELTLPQSRLWIPELEIGLGLWTGIYENCERQWLRWYDALGNWLPTPEEQQHQRAEQERQRAEQERQRAEQAEQELTQLKVRLKTMGVDLE
jgi:Uma2 family endonuclease